jgi:hypothetical protein
MARTGIARRAPMKTRGSAAELCYDVPRLLQMFESLGENCDKATGLCCPECIVSARHPPLATSYADWTAVWQHTLASNPLGPALLNLIAP